MQVKLILLSIEIIQGGKDILAVQTFRNTLLTSSLMATSAMVVVVLLLNVLANSTRQGSSISVILPLII